MAAPTGITPRYRVASTFQKQAASSLTAPFQSRQVLLGVVDSGAKKSRHGRGLLRLWMTRPQTAQVLETLSPKPTGPGTILLLRACVTFIAAHGDHLRRSLNGDLLGRMDIPFWATGAQQRSWGLVVRCAGLRRFRLPTDPGHRRAHDSRDGPGVLTQDEGMMALANRNWLAITAITMTERRRPDRSRGHEVEQPDHRRLDMPEPERRRQGPGEAWPPPVARDRFEMPSTR